MLIRRGGGRGEHAFNDDKVSGDCGSDASICGSAVSLFVDSGVADIGDTCDIGQDGLLPAEGMVVSLPRGSADPGDEGGMYMDRQGLPLSPQPRSCGLGG